MHERIEKLERVVWAAVWSAFPATHPCHAADVNLAQILACAVHDLKLWPKVGEEGRKGAKHVATDERDGGRGAAADTVHGQLHVQRGVGQNDGLLDEPGEYNRVRDSRRSLASWSNRLGTGWIGGCTW